MEALGADEFMQPDIWRGDLFLDTGRHFHKVMGGRSQMASGVLSFMTGGRVAQNAKRADEKGVKGNLKGEGKYLGGLWVVGPGGQGVVYQHYEEVWGDHAPLEEVRRAVAMIEPPSKAPPAGNASL